MNSLPKHKIKMIAIFAVGFIAITVLTLLIFLAGKRTYTVTFDLNGGTYISGDLSQSVTQGQNATPPVAEKEGCYLRTWDGSYNRVTGDVTVTAVWEYVTTAGILYNNYGSYSEISGCYQHLNGNVYIGSYNGNSPVFGVQQGAFRDRNEIEHIFFLNGPVAFEKEAFERCSAMTSIIVPNSLRKIAEGAFRDCTALEEIELYDKLILIGDEAFENCTALEEIIIPSSVQTMGENVFKGCENLTVKVSFKESETPDGFSENWFGDATVVYEYSAEETAE